METTDQEPARECTSQVGLSTFFIPHYAYLYLTTVPLIFFIQMEENMMRHRAILTGTFHKATHFNKPLPRMKVQPLHVSGMINKRLRARERRRAHSWTLTSLAKHMENEAEFERTLQRNAARFGQEFENVFQHIDWGGCISPPVFPLSDAVIVIVLELRLNFPLHVDKTLKAQIREIDKCFEREEARLHAPYTDELIKIVEGARREKHRNLTNEKIRERRGEMTSKWLKKRRSRPPSLIRYRMTEKEKMTWWVSKCVSEVGYIGMLKQKLGMKLKNPDALKREYGLPHMKEKTDRDIAIVEMGNRRREELGSDTLEE